MSALVGLWWKLPLHLLISGLFFPVTGTGGLHNGDSVVSPLRALASGGSECLRFILMDDSLLLYDFPTR